MHISTYKDKIIKNLVTKTNSIPSSILDHRGSSKETLFENILTRELTRHPIKRLIHTRKVYYTQEIIVSCARCILSNIQWMKKFNGQAKLISIITEELFRKSIFLIWMVRYSTSVSPSFLSNQYNYKFGNTKYTKVRTVQYICKFRCMHFKYYL